MKLHPIPFVGIAIVGMLILAGLTNFDREQRISKPATNQKNEISVQANTPIIASENHSTLPAINPNSNRHEWREEQNLIAQRNMANWAFWMIMVSGVGVFVGGFGLYFLKRTLDETREMTIATRNIGENQTRGYLVINNLKCEIIVEGEKTYILTHYEANNIGNTPIMNVHITISTMVKDSTTFKNGEFHHSENGVIGNVNDASARMILPNNPWTLQAIQLNDEITALLFCKDKKFRTWQLRFETDYEDIFGVWRSESFTYKCGAFNGDIGKWSLTGYNGLSEVRVGTNWIEDEEGN